MRRTIHLSFGEPRVTSLEWDSRARLQCTRERNRLRFEVAVAQLTKLVNMRVENLAGSWQDLPSLFVATARNARLDVGIALAQILLIQEPRAGCVWVFLKQTERGGLMNHPISSVGYGISGRIHHDLNPRRDEQQAIQAPANQSGEIHRAGSATIDVFEISPEALQAIAGSSAVEAVGGAFDVPLGDQIDAETLQGIYPSEFRSSALSDAQRQRVDALEKELDGIFGSPKSLNADEQKQEAELLVEIDKILGARTAPEDLSAEDYRKLETIHKQIDELFADGKIAKDEEEKLDVLFKRIDAVLSVPGQAKELSAGDQEKLKKLEGKLDELYGISAPSEKDLARAADIVAELDRIHEAAASDSTQVAFDPYLTLSKDDQAKAEKLIQELDRIFGVHQEPARLSETDQKRIDDINRRIDELYGIKSPTEAQLKKADEIGVKIDALFEDGVLTATEEKTLNGLEKQLHDIFGSPKESLSKAEQQEVEELFARLDHLIGAKVPSNAELERVDAIHKELAALFEGSRKAA